MFAVILPLYLLAVLSAPATKFERYLMFVYPSMAVLGACGVSDILAWLRADRLKPLAVLVLAGVTTFFPGNRPPLVIHAGPAESTSLLQRDPVTRFFNWVKNSTTEGQVVGVTCPGMPHPARAFSEGRMPDGIARELSALVARTTDRKVVWVDLGGGPAGSGRGLQSVDWLYLLYWYDNAGPDLDALQRSAHVRLNPVSRTVSNGLRHMVYKVARAGSRRSTAPETISAKRRGFSR